MSTGVKVDDAVVNQFNDFKLKKLGVKYIIYKIDKVNGADKIITDTTGDSSATFDSFQASLPSNDARYAVIDHDYTTKDGRPGNKIVFIAWIPDSAPVKKKMIYAGSKDALSGVLLGIMVKLQATDASELTLDIVNDQCNRY